jgi:hypothetical protein
MKNVSRIQKGTCSLTKNPSLFVCAVRQEARGQEAAAAGGRGFALRRPGVFNFKYNFDFKCNFNQQGGGQGRQGGEWDKEDKNGLREGGRDGKEIHGGKRRGLGLGVRNQEATAALRERQSVYIPLPGV